jgi:hypothetical protein
MAGGGPGNPGIQSGFNARLATGGGPSNILTLLPYAGNKVLVGGSIITVPPAGYTTQVSDHLLTAAGADSGAAGVANTLYYVYVSNPFASFQPQAIRLSATPPSLVNGVKYLGVAGNALNWRFVGWVYLNSTPQFESDVAAQLIVNYYNRLELKVYINPGYVNNNTYNSYAFSSAVYAPIHAGVGDSLSFISNGEDEVRLDYQCVATTIPGGSIFPGIGIDSSTSAQNGMYCGSGAAALNVSCTTVFDGLLSEGFHTAYMLCYTNAPASIYSEGPQAGGAADPGFTLMSGRILG